MIKKIQLYATREDLKVLFLALVGYLSVAIGGLGLGESYSLIKLVIAAGFIFLAIAVLRRESLKEIVLITLLIFLYLLLKTPQTEQYVYMFSKFYGFVVAGIILYVINRYGVLKYKKQYIDSLIIVGVVLLLATLIYKFNFGFYDRQVRYFLNGPIVFGWMMGLLFFISLNEYFRSGRLAYVIVSAIFFLGLLWSESKGPVLSLIAVFLLYLIIKRDFRKSVFIISLMVLAASLYTAVGHFSNQSSSSQSTRVISETMLMADGSYMKSNSYSLRTSMFHESLEMFKSRPFLGIGAGNFGNHVTDDELIRRDLYYPHNIVLEIISEHGLIGLALFVFIFSYVFYKSDFFSRILFLFFALCLSFSGDMAYWRMLVFLPLAFTGYQLFYTEERK